MSETLKTYKGFSKDLTCRGFQYEEGKEYETCNAEACKSGFHACEYPLDCLSYYDPANSVYRVVEQSGELSRHADDSKVASTKIKIGAEISIAGLVKAAIDYTKERVNPESKSNEDYGASSATGYKGASSATGDKGASSATGYCGASSATGDYGASSATGGYGASSATGYCGASSATGGYGASSATGDCGAAQSTGYKSRVVAGHKNSIATAFGYKSKAKGVIDSWLTIAEWTCDGYEDTCWNKPDCWTLKAVKTVRVDGEIIKGDTWYSLIDGEFVEVE